MSKLRNRGVKGEPVPTPKHLAERDLDLFRNALLMKIMKRREYGYWSGIEKGFYHDRLHEEVRELDEAIEEGDLPGIMEECIDVAAFAMMLFTNALQERETR